MNTYTYKKDLCQRSHFESIEKEKPSAAEEMVENGNTFPKDGVVIGSPYVNVRKDASPDGEIVEVLRENDLVKMLGGIENGYYRVKTSVNNEVYILGDYLKEV